MYTLYFSKERAGSANSDIGISGIPVPQRLKWRGFWRARDICRVRWNGESEHIGVARFLINKLDRIAEFKGRDLDAQMPPLDAYRRMLSVFEPIRSTLTGS